MPDPIIGAGIMAGGKLLGAANEAGAQRRRNNILTQGARQQNRAGMESAGVMGDFLSQLRTSAPNPAVERGAFTGALGNSSVGALPTASRRFRTDAADATAGARGYGQDMAGLFARIRAPQHQRRQESELLMDMDNALKPIQMRSQDDAYLTQLRAGQVQANPWLGLLGQGLSNAGSYMVANG